MGKLDCPARPRDNIYLNGLVNVSFYDPAHIFETFNLQSNEKYQKEKYKKIENDISNAKSFDDLYEVIKASGGMQSSQDFFKPKDLLDLIEQFQRGGKTINAITNSFGLRQKVIELTKLGEIRKNLQL